VRDANCASPGAGPLCDWRAHRDDRSRSV